MTADDYVRIIVALFVQAEHDHARHDMLGTLMDEAGYDDPWLPLVETKPINWESVVREVLGA